MWIDIIIVAISLIILLVMNYLYKRLTCEINWLDGCEDSKKAIKLYSFCRIFIHIFSMILVGVLMYVYVFQ